MSGSGVWLRRWMNVEEFSNGVSGIEEEEEEEGAHHNHMHQCMGFVEDKTTQLEEEQM